MKKVYKFSKAFTACAVISALIILCGIAGFFVKGINFGLDFRPGLIEEVRIAPPAISVTYSGVSNVNVELSRTSLDLVVNGLEEKQTHTFEFGHNPSVAAIADALNQVEGVSAKVLSHGDTDSYELFTNSAVSARLSDTTPFLFYVSDSSSSVSIDDVRASVADLDVQVKEVGSGPDSSFQIRAKAEAEGDSSQKLQQSIVGAMQAKFGKDKVVIIKTDFVGSSFSGSLVGKSVILAFFTIFLIWVYATIRFHWDFALGAVIALVHDCAILFTLIIWTQLEFSTTTLAAVLTIFGYSINATVVILDRVRDNVKQMEVTSFTEILNKSLADTFSRSIITTVTTLFASVSLWVFTTGSIKTFAIVLTAGLISGCYSSLFISSGFINWTRRAWSPKDPTHVKPHKEKGPSLAQLA